ncbi:hypothetical protein GOB87_05230 [Acetobacter estunensis]|uniref:Uncharacterized protein n=1 Tax=Acetobacter estunensis TaxID=104097 RepID=A0A967ECW4_9PROT|nr:hypothetical protein [Acetobacter estunensis]NHO53365.1 hypothetical protein [Acetobacter estunensis]
MGAYAALAFSRRLNADAVLAAVPKWSLDPAEIEIPQHYVDNNLRPGMEGMGLRASQVQGKIFIPYDPGDHIDNIHAHKIAEIVPESQLVPTFYTGHLIFDHIRGSANIKALVDALRSEDSTRRVPAVLSRARRHNSRNIQCRLESGYASHPLLCSQILQRCLCQNDELSRAVIEDEPLIIRVIAALCRYRYWTNAFDLLTNLINRHLTGEHQPSGYIFPFTSPGKLPRIITWHGTILAYAPEQKGFLCQSLIIADNAAIPVLCDTSTDRYLLCIERYGILFYFAETDSGLRLTNNPEDAANLAFTSFQNRQLLRTISDTSDSFLSVQTRQGNLCAHPDHVVVMDSPNCLQWEAFALIPVQIQAHTPVQDTLSYPEEMAPCLSAHNPQLGFLINVQ